MDPVQYNNKVVCGYSEAIYQEMGSKRFGIEFCCLEDKAEWGVKFELLKLNKLKDLDKCVTPGLEPAIECRTMTIGFSKTNTVTYLPCGGSSTVTVNNVPTGTEYCYDLSFDPILIDVTAAYSTEPCSP